MLLDSNIIIYATQPAYPQLREFVRTHRPAVSAVSYVETLGYHRLTDVERSSLEEFFAAAEVLMIDEPILDRAVVLRQQRRMSLGDALIAATAMTRDLTLVTRNSADFQWVPGLRLLNPLGEQAAGENGG